MTSVRGDELPTPLGDEPEAIDSQPVVCISPVVVSQLVAGVLCPVVDDQPDHVPTPAEEDEYDEDGAIVRGYARRVARSATSS